MRCDSGEVEYNAIREEKFRASGEEDVNTEAESREIFVF